MICRTALHGHAQELVSEPNHSIALGTFEAVREREAPALSWMWYNKFPGTKSYNSDMNLYEVFLAWLQVVDVTRL